MLFFSFLQYQALVLQLINNTFGTPENVENLTDEEEVLIEVPCHVLVMLVNLTKVDQKKIQIHVRGC